MGSLLSLTGCAATYVPVIGNMTPTPTPTAVVTQTPTETPIAIITGTPTESPTPIPVSLTPIAEADAHLNIIGEKEEGSDIYRMKLVNSTGYAIIGFTVIPETAKEMPENMLYKAEPFADKEERILYYKQPSKKKKNIRYDLEVVFEDKTYYRMTDVPLSDIKEAVIYYNDGVVYLVYISKKTGEQTSTKDAELALHNPAQGDPEESEGDRQDDDDSDYDDQEYDDQDYDQEYDDQEYDDQDYDQEYDDQDYDNQDYDQEYDDQEYDDQDYDDQDYDQEYDDQEYDDQNYDEE